MIDRSREKLYFLGIGGTGMASVAGLFQEAGYQVTGSDAGVYPPMSTMLAELGINVRAPYSSANIDAESPDYIVIANALSRGNEELEKALTSGIPYTSFPALLGERILSNKTTIVVSGTHGKTTTTSLLAHILNELGEEPGFIVGGLPRNFPRSFRLGKSRLFVIEGDEYDTAFFDKGPKFLHYRPSYCIFNNLEYDHADIYPNVEAIEAQFQNLIKLVKDPKKIIANIDDQGVRRTLEKIDYLHKVTSVSTLGKSTEAAFKVTKVKPGTDYAGHPEWHAIIQTPSIGPFEIKTRLAGHHNIANIIQTIACLELLALNGDLQSKLSLRSIVDAIETFAGVARRLELIGGGRGIDIFEDFAHHPTAVRTVLEGFKAMYPNKRLIVAFEPRSATQRRNIFMSEFAESLRAADLVYIGECPLDKRIPEEGRMNTDSLKQAIGDKAMAFKSNPELLEALRGAVKTGDAVIFMSSGSFSGIQHKLSEALKSS